MSLYAFNSDVFVFFKQKTAYEMRISDWSSDVCSSDLSTRRIRHVDRRKLMRRPAGEAPARYRNFKPARRGGRLDLGVREAVVKAGVAARRDELGRASWRERGRQSG